MVQHSPQPRQLPILPSLPLLLPSLPLLREGDPRIHCPTLRSLLLSRRLLGEGDPWVGRWRYTLALVSSVRRRQRTQLTSQLRSLL